MDLREAAKYLAYVIWDYRPPNPGAEDHALIELAKARRTFEAVGLGIRPVGPPRYVLAYEDSDTAGWRLAPGALRWDHLEFPLPVPQEDQGSGAARPWGYCLRLEREGRVIWAVTDQWVPDGWVISAAGRYDGGEPASERQEAVPEFRLVGVSLVAEPMWRGSGGTH